MSTKENKIASTFYLLLLTLLFLSIFSFGVPDSFFKAYNIKKIDYISPLLTKPNTLTLAAKKKKKNKAPVAIVKKGDSPIEIPNDLVLIEDYSTDGSQLNRFIKSLYNIKSSNENVRIAFYGDSFIEGDIVTMDLRDSLQKKFGGNGVGFLPITSEVPLFRRSMPCEFSNWTSYSIANRNGKKQTGICGSVFVPNTDAEFKLIPTKAFKNVQLLYRNAGADVVVESNYNKNTYIDTLKYNNDLSVCSLTKGEDNLYKYQLKLSGSKDLKVYGVTIENGNGVYLDNFSIRGNSGLGLKEIADSQYVAFQKLFNYKLIVLQFGLNAAMPETTDFSMYEKGMTKMIRHLKTLFPTTSFLLVGTSDRSYKSDGVFTTMPSIPLLVEAQRNIAKESGILFWDMYEAMGGENSMVALVKDKKANLDYTHLTFPGGTLIADKLYKSIVFEYKKYETKENSKVRLAVR